MEENNILIAEFLGYRLRGGCIDFRGDEPFTEVTSITNGEVNSLGYVFYEDDLKFHKDWNWLMEVVDKIEGLSFQKLSFNFNIQKDRVSLNYTHVSEPKKSTEMFFEWGQKTKIENIYKIAVEFIKWYNQQNK